MATNSEGALRQASTVLRANGGFEVILRLPGLAVSGAEGEQLGLATPQFQDVPLGPAVWRRTGANASLLIAADAVAALVATLDAVSAESLLASAVGVVVSGVLQPITKAEALMAAGAPCAYRLSLQEPAWP